MFLRSFVVTGTNALGDYEDKSATRPRRRSFSCATEHDFARAAQTFASLLEPLMTNAAALKEASLLARRRARAHVEAHAHGLYRCLHDKQAS